MNQDELLQLQLAFVLEVCGWDRAMWSDTDQDEKRALNHLVDLGVVVSGVEQWCDEHDAVLLMERNPAREEDGTPHSHFVRVRLDPRAPYRITDHGDTDPSLRIALMRASLAAVRAVKENKP